MGSVPAKRHTIHEKPEGGIYYEQLFGTEGFHGLSSLLYHTHRPTMISSYGQTIDLKPKAAIASMYRHSSTFLIAIYIPYFLIVSALE